MMEKLPRFITPADNHPCLVVHMGMSEANMINMQAISRSHDVLGRKLKSSWDPGVLNSFSNSMCLRKEKKCSADDYIDDDRIIIYDTNWWALAKYEMYFYRDKEEYFFSDEQLV